MKQNLRSLVRSPRALALLAAIVATASAASARTEVLRFQHPDPSTVSGFKVYVGSSPGVYQTTLDIGKPAASSGVFSYSLQVPDPNTVYVSVSAYGSTGLESPKSNEQQRLGLLGTPGKPQIMP
jgi:hypothetical protein